MKTNLIVVDEFYNNVDDVRKFALSQQFDVTGNYPGVRTQNFINDSTKQTIQNLVSESVSDWLDGPEGYSGAFQLTTSEHKSWVHNDSYNNWAGVLYLTPDAPVSGGTGFFRSKIDGSLTSTSHDLGDGVYQNMSLWEKVGEVGNVYNRLILFRADQWHTSLDYFGDDLHNGRLTQVFFFKT